MLSAAVLWPTDRRRLFTALAGDRSAVLLGRRGMRAGSGRRRLRRAGVPAAGPRDLSASVICRAGNRIEGSLSCSICVVYASG